MFSCEFYEISKNTFFTENLWATVSAHCYIHTKNVIVLQCKNEDEKIQNKLSFLAIRKY